MVSETTIIGQISACAALHQRCKGCGRNELVNADEMAEIAGAH
jgi:hypothetical protein